MKRLLDVIVLSLLLSVASCHRPDTRAAFPAASPSLVAIDTLMWSRPDSALKLLLNFAASPEADSLGVFDGHYCQLLISELLYKNYYKQSYREELLKAVGYFDSIDDRFLAARAHYINGAGLYEREDVELACEEYLKALELMEGFFDEKDLTGHRAAFMFLTYNRLLELFSAQYMMDPAIACGEKALSYCQKEPFLNKEIPNTYYFIGKQYDKKGEKDIARNYYEQAIEGLSDINNLVYRDVVATKALSEYQAGCEADSSLSAIRQVLAYANSEKEKLTRFLSMGGIFTVEQSYDSALYYLIPVFEFQDNMPLQILAAEHLLTNYDHLGDKEHLAECMQFLAIHKKPEGDAKALVSKLEDKFKNYMSQKQKKEAEAERRKSVRKTLRIVVPIAFVIVIAIIVLAKLKSKKLLKEQQEEADHAHQKEREELERSLQQNLQKKEAYVNVLEKALIQQREEAKQRRMAFLKEPICEAIFNKAKSKQITTRDVAHELGIALKDEDLEQLGEAVAKHYDGFDHVLLSQCPNLKHGYLALCHLHLLGLSESEIAALKNVSYSAIRKQNESLQEKLGVDETISAYVLKVAERLCETPKVEQEKQLDMDLRQTTEENSGQPMEMEQESSLKSSLKSSQKILELISASPNITISEIADCLGMTKRGVDKNIKRLKEQGIIRRIGPDKGGHWEVIDQY